MNKEKLITNIISHLENALSIAKHAANEAHLAATDDQSVAETQYDTYTKSNKFFPTQRELKVF